MNILKNIYRNSFFFIIRMILIAEIIRLLYFSYNSIDIQWGYEFSLIIIGYFSFMILYSLTAVISPSNLESSPLFLAETIVKSIRNSLDFNGVIVNGHRGVYRYSPEIVDGVIFHKYNPEENPHDLIIVIRTNINLLQNINTGDAERLIKNLEILRQEAEFMIENKCESFIK